MPRAKAILQNEFPYNITARCINRQWFHLPMPKVWDIFCEELTRTVHEQSLEVHSFVLMSNHIHLIASTPESNISQCMHQFIGQSSRRLTRESDRINQTFGGRHYKCILHKYNYFLSAYKYVYRNPVTAEICKAVEEYPYSTLHGKLGLSELKIPVVPDNLILENREETLLWLNTTPDAQKLEGVRFGLKRQLFKSKKTEFNNFPLISDDDVL